MILQVSKKWEAFKTPTTTDGQRGPTAPIETMDTKPPGPVGYWAR